MASVTIPKNGTPCVTGGRCGYGTTWHYIGSEAAERCARLAKGMQSTQGFVDAVNSMPSFVDRVAQGEQITPGLRAMTDAEAEVYRRASDAAVMLMPFYANLMYQVRPVAVSEPPIGLGPDGELMFETRAALTRDWRLILNFDWVQSLVNEMADKHSESIRQAIRDAGYEPTDEAVRFGVDSHVAPQVARVILHELGHAAFNSMDYVEENGLDHELMNLAEDAVINNSLRLLGHPDAHKGLPNTDIHGAFIEDAIYGGTLECDEDHSWEYVDPKTGQRQRRCSYDQTVMHYYHLAAKRRADQDHKQGSDKGEGQSSNSSSTPGNSNGGSKSGQQQGNRSSNQNSDGNSTNGSPADSGGGNSSRPDSSPGDKQSPQGGAGGDDDHDHQSSHGCGREAAKKYEDDPYEKRDEVSRERKDAASRITAKALEEWAADNEDAAKAIGLGSGSFLRAWAKSRTFRDRVAWDKLMTTKLQRSITSSRMVRETYASPNRRSSEMGIIRRGERPGNDPSVACGIDTSGSMSSDDLFMAYNAVRNIVKRAGLEDIKAFAVDTEVKEVASIRKAEDLAPLLVGGGGTDMCEGVLAAAKMKRDICVILTDGEVPWGAMAERPKEVPRNMKVIVGVINESSQLSRLTESVPSWMTAVPLDKKLMREGPESNTGYFG